MTIVVEWPPNIEEIKAVFNLEGKKPIFAWGKLIYNPYDGFISTPLLVHETTHSFQQEGIGPEIWWKQYLLDPEFRKSQEIDAYHQQYLIFCDLHKDRNLQVRYLNDIARDFSSPLYGSIVTVSEAIKLIKYGEEEN